jgi:hypothetical protein
MYYSPLGDGLSMIDEIGGRGFSSREFLNSSASWGVEVLKGERWVLLREGLFRRIAHFATYEEAVQAAVRAWRQHDCPARPLRLPAGERPSHPA